MREILYRGMHSNLKQFITGLPAFGLDGELNMLQDNADTYYDILPETVGQYTGSNDKNGKKIFVGDIVKVLIMGGYSAHFTDIEHILPVVYNENNANYEPFNKCRMWRDGDLKLLKVEVIGNVYENPDLLKGD